MTSEVIKTRGKHYFILTVLCLLIWIHIPSVHAQPEVNSAHSIQRSGSQYPLTFIETSNGNFAVLARTSDSWFAQGDEWFVMLDKEGNKQWDVLLENQSFGKLVESDVGDFYVTGNRDKAVFLTKLNSKGELLWVNEFPGIYFSDLLASNDGIILAGSSFNETTMQNEMFISKTDFFGNTLWNRTYRSDDEHTVIPNRIISAQYGGYIVSGTVSCKYCNVYEANVILQKLDENGIASWNQTYGSNSYGSIENTELFEDSDGNIVFNVEKEYFLLFSQSSELVKIDRFGNLLWNKTYSEITSNSLFCSAVSSIESGYAILESQDGNFNASSSLLKIDSNGELEYEIVLGEHYYRDSILLQRSTGEYLILGSTNDGQNSDITLTLTKSEGPDILLLWITLGSTLVAGILVYNRYFTKKSKIILTPGKSRELIQELFQSQSTLYFLLMGQSSIKDKHVENEIKKAIPHKIYDFKFLLQPVRLSITKVLFENIRLSSVELKEILEVSWNEYRNNITALQKKRYVDIVEGFEDAKVTQFVSLTQLGIESYKILTDLLHLFLDNTPDYQNYIREAQSLIDDPDKDVYPKNY